MSGLELMGIMGYEWIFILLIVVILIFGAKKLPQLAKSLGRSSGEFKKGKQQSEREALADMEGDPDEREKLEKVAKSLSVDFEGVSDSDLKEAIKKAMPSTE